MWPFRPRYLPNGMLRGSEKVKPPTKPPKGPSVFYQPVRPLVVIIIEK